MKQQFEYRPIHGQRARKYAPVRPDDGPNDLQLTYKMIGVLIFAPTFLVTLIFIVAYLGHKFNW